MVAFPNYVSIGTAQNPLILVSYYDGAGNRTLLETNWGPARYTFDALSRLLQAWDPGFLQGSVGGGVSQWQYDARDLLVQQTDNAGTTSTYTYDENGDLLQTRHATSARVEIEHAYYTRDQVGNPLTKQTGFGLFQYHFDQLYRLTQESNPAGTTTYGYDAGDRRTSLQNAAGTVNYGYDQADQRTSDTGPGGTTQRFYDLNGNLVKVLPPSGPPTSFTWDAVNRLEERRRMRDEG